MGAEAEGGEIPEGTPPVIPPPPAGPGAGGKGDGPKFTQDDLNARDIAGKKAGAAAAKKQLAEELGVSLDEAAKIIKAHNDRTEAEKTELQRQADALAAAEATQTQLKAELETERLRNRLQTALVAPVVDAEGNVSAAGCDPSAVGPILDLAVTHALQAPDGEADPVSWAIGQLRASLPQLFTGSVGANGAGQQTPPPGAPSGGIPVGQRNQQQKPLTPMERAQKMLDAQKTKVARPAGGGPVWKAPESS
jgi:hypothetical protein